ncbi:MAG TPA: hypothetical protein VK611_27435 [Acidimicrobiales bacterium]|nr:hypothetical protein [Acidimicrobiales bacterium]
MARRRTTFGKLQRDRDKQAKQKAKIERRITRAEQSTDEEPEETVQPAGQPDQSAVLAALADLHAAYDDGQLSLDDFEVKRDELRNSLQID